VRSEWNQLQPRAAEENGFLESHGWDEYSEWHLGLTDGAAEGTKARYAFVYGDFRRVHRMGLIACHYRAAEWRHKEMELAARELLQLLRSSPPPPCRGHRRLGAAPALRETELSPGGARGACCGGPTGVSRDPELTGANREKRHCLALGRVQSGMVASEWCPVSNLDQAGCAVGGDHLLN
jgi:hypothetical protein